MNEHSDWKELALVTPINKEQNVKFYTERFGFDIVDEEKNGNVTVYQFKLCNK